ncbi:porin family protein [Chitinophaga tropicalis]|uniref:Outer membrane beta-barrel protein n=1 Tax=Chitinophaga tropicalis TaxID=2683588 RepID=A0A7K1U7I6_9BACT|nr:porin family protein [Chitinophaga tropicalis]MVT10309.1 outer membrane beta-barrel protein [Chitinophaga tropicalis]
MKKLLLICLVLVSTKGFSQSLLKRLSFGLKAGANYSNFTGADFETEGLVGFHAGAIVNFKITDNFSIQEEFLFSSQGAKVKGDVFNKENIKIYYGTVPFLLKYRTKPGFYIEAGAQAGFRIKDDIGDDSVKEFAKKMDLAAVGGLGFQMRNGLGFGARYVAGLSKVSDFKISDVNPDYKNSVVQASVFYIF